MQNEEKSKLEERIIAYFDGSLPGEASNSLLREVSGSAEKRALFKGYESLDRLITAARVPMEAPFAARRAIADRIPGLLAFIPGLLGTAETMPVLTQSANPFIAFFTRMSLSTAVSIGTAVVVLTTAGIVVKNKLEANAPHNAKIAVMQNQASTNPAVPVYAAIPSHNLTMPEIGRANASVVRGPVSVRRSNLQENIARNVNVSSNDIPSGTNSSPVSSDNDESASPAMASLVSPRLVLAVAADIPGTSLSILSPLPMNFGEGITVRPFASSGVRYVMVNTVNGQGGATPVLNTFAGLELGFGGGLALRLQTGSSQFAQVTDQTAPPEQGLLLPAYRTTQTVLLKAAQWATAGISYSLPIGQSLPLIVSAEGGPVWSTSANGFMGALGMATEIPFSSQWILRPSLTYDLVRMPVVSLSSDAPVATNAVYEHSAIAQTSMWTAAVGFNLSLMFRY